MVSEATKISCLCIKNQRVKENLLHIRYNLLHLTVIHYPNSHLCNFILMVGLLLLAGIKIYGIVKILKSGELAKGKIMTATESLIID